eukprot:scaffold1566_cov131-Skeletonema_dohrnii-CCMP3373.AAC.1
MSHQVTYDVVATPMRRTNACCGLTYSQRDIRYGRQLRIWRPSQMSHQVTYVVVATLTRANNA